VDFQVLARFDLGDGDPGPFPIYQNDLKTPIEGRLYYLNSSAGKRTIVPNESRAVELVVSNSAAGVVIWKVNPRAENGDVALSALALAGADLWVEEIVREGRFSSEALVTALREAKVKIDFGPNECRILGDAVRLCDPGRIPGPPRRV